ncbi:hypothetical protein KSF_108990 [Reticulibacter mediterranei]|uniref:Peptidase C39 domain-containing protein n=1 Tax=Reticulibacter mediterranei TaxID=2778369 RepID=A0A8J3J520_9CHLR|nr:cysteine peptidase family C39 domain-containing protein [Reticulibacter mediterranei]GHP00852.1 hypothetical protein KSF_108990 [Reticulibacter mediterranei]
MVLVFVALLLFLLPLAVLSLQQQPAGTPPHYRIAPEVPVRLNQLDPAQYCPTSAPCEEWRTWAGSACSAAATAANINAFLPEGARPYRVVDILHEEIRQRQISPRLGLLNGAESIEKTVKRFGFTTHPLDHPSLNDVLQIANLGTPVIVNWPPELWKGGHFLLVRGGNQTSVFLTDSSSYNFVTLPRATFLARWAGFAVVIEPDGSGLPKTSSMLQWPAA